MTIQLPSRIFENNLSHLLEALGRADESNCPLNLNFEHVKYWIPPAIVALCAMIDVWKERGRKITLVNLEECEALAYLQRVDFFETLGISIPEKFQRHDSSASLVEIQRINPGKEGFRDELSGKLAAVLAGSDDSSNDAYQLTQFSIGEIVSNIRHHAGRHGYISAQYFGKRDWARIGVADAGVGILDSFRRTESPHYRDGMTDQDALEIAMQPWTSSRTHLIAGPYGESPNRGIGLKMILRLALGTGGEMLIASGNAYMHFRSKPSSTPKSLSNNARFPGTMVSVLFDRGQITNFRDLLNAATRGVGLTSSHSDENLFQ